MTHRFRHRRGAIIVLLLLGSGCSPSPWDRLRGRLELKQGNQAYLHGEYHEAIAHYEKVLSYVPDSAPAHLNHAYSALALFRAAENLDERRSLADEAIDSFSRYVATLESLGTDGPGRERVERHILTLYLDSEQPEQAYEFLQAKLERDSTDVSTLQMLAHLAIEQGDLDRALECNLRRIALDPNDPQAHYALAVLAWQFSYYGKVSAEGRAELLDRGLDAVLRAIELDQNYFEALVYANLLYREKAKYAPSDSSRAEFEAKYREYEERARSLREVQENDSAMATPKL